MGWIDELLGQTIALDTAPLIDYIEENPEYVACVEPFFAAVGRGDIQLITSTLTLLELLVHPLRWHRKLVATKWDYSSRRKKIGRPSIGKEVEKLVLKFARENPSWGYDRIADALKILDHVVTDQTVGNILKQHGIEPAPERETRTSWKTFLHAHWDSIAATDFTTVEVWTPKGLVTYYLLFVLELKTRRVHFAGCTSNPNDAWMKQVARNLTEAEDGFLTGCSHLLMDRDTKFTESLRRILEGADVQPVILPPRSPNLNAHIERFMRSVKHECLNRLIFFGDSQLRNAVSQYLLHYHHERNHQGIGHRIIEPTALDNDDAEPMVGKVECRRRLGGMLRYYHRSAA